jgi:hypothetical protein
LVTLANLLESIDAPEAIRTSRIPSISTTSAMPAPSQIQNLLLFRDPFKKHLPRCEENGSARGGRQSGCLMTNATSYARRVPLVPKRLARLSDP